MNIARIYHRSHTEMNSLPYVYAHGKLEDLYADKYPMEDFGAPDLVSSNVSLDWFDDGITLVGTEFGNAYLFKWRLGERGTAAPCKGLIVLATDKDSVADTVYAMANRTV